MYIHVRLVSRSHSGNPKMADPANVWDLPINTSCTIRRMRPEPDVVSVYHAPYGP